MERACPGRAALQVPLVRQAIWVRLGQQETLVSPA